MPALVAGLYIKRLASVAAFALTLFMIARPAYAEPSPFLMTNGNDIRNNYGCGDAVQLRGVNLGGWLLMEGWMCPMDSSGLADNYSVLQTLDKRFLRHRVQALLEPDTTMRGSDVGPSTTFGRLANAGE